MKSLSSIFSVFNFKKYCREYKTELWECPPFIFTVMGVIVLLSIFVTYFVGRMYVDPLVVVLIVCLVTGILFVLSYFVMLSFERIARASREKSEFVGIISHQLRTPLSAVKWQLDLLLHRNVGTTGESGKASLLAIEEQNERMIGLTNDLLELVRFEDGAAVFVIIPFSLAELLKEIVAKNTERAIFSNVELNFLAPKENIIVEADRDKIKSAFSHILDNAIRYSPNGGKVEVSLEKDGNFARVTVVDEGIGISSEEARGVFQKFFRGSASRKYKSDGMGIGLYLVKSIVQFFKGRAGFSSVEGRGSIFWFTLPLAKKD